jgi:hypothetical protein
MTEGMEPAVAAPSPSFSLQLTREEFVLLVSEFRRAQRGWRDWLAAGGVVGGLLVAGGLIAVAERMSLPSSASWACFAVGWGLALIPVVLNRRRAGRLMRLYGLRCPGCDAPLVDKLFEIGRVEQITVTGRCIKCDARFLGPDVA